MYRATIAVCTTNGTDAGTPTDKRFGKRFLQQLLIALSRYRRGTYYSVEAPIQIGLQDARRNTPNVYNSTTDL